MSETVGYQGEFQEIGERSLDRWGAYVIEKWGNTLIPVHGDDEKGLRQPIIGHCRCRILAGQWVYEPDACPLCKRLGDEWNAAVRMPASFDEA